MAYRATRQLVILNEDRLANRLAGPHTICVTGYPRGGTSAVGLFLREIGLFMGDEVIPFSQEDRRLQDAHREAQQFEQIVHEYDAAHPVWGFKLPIGSRMSRLLIGKLRNPIQIMVSRNPVSIIRSRFARRRQIEDHQAEFLRLFEGLAADLAQTARTAATLTSPLIFAEYERLLADPRAFGEDLAAAIGLPAEGEAFERAVGAISTPGYQRYSGDPNPKPLERRSTARKLFR